MSEEMEKWRLYAMRPQDISLEASETERFCRRTAGYVLLYRREDPPKRAMELTGAHLRRLSSGDRLWLRDCNLVILAEECGKKSREVARTLGDMVTALEAALEAEAKTVQAGTEQAETVLGKGPGDFAGDGANAASAAHRESGAAAPWAALSDRSGVPGNAKHFWGSAGNSLAGNLSNQKGPPRGLPRGEEDAPVPAQPPEGEDGGTGSPVIKEGEVEAE